MLEQIGKYHVLERIGRLRGQPSPRRLAAAIYAREVALLQAP